MKEYFEPVLGIYTLAEDGKLLVEWLMEDWAMFENEHIDLANAKDLLADVMDDGELVRKKFVPLDSSETSTLQQWTSLKAELKHQNRFFPESSLDVDRIRELLPYLRLEVGEITREWYRGRIQTDQRVYPADKMGAPPKQRAAHGRANPAGIPYLYLASDAETAVSEIRPHTGETATVAEFELPEALKIVDLREPRRSISPFLLVRDDKELDRGDIGFLDQLGRELTRPIVPQTAAIDYIPTQYLCEYIKSCGFDGIIYSSSVGDGVNLALFNPDLAKIGKIQALEVTKVQVELGDVPVNYG